MTLPSSKESWRRLGAEPVVLDGLDRDGVARAVAAARPDAVLEVHAGTVIV